ncbi:MAG: type I restriction endonuclease subunit S [Gammaproteobacteria bacterium]|nr:MAG: type I restriction endonuclease subunit S [Gammaproteobacteria bacterium]
MADIKKIVTDHIDVWTAAIEKKSTMGRGSKKKISLHGIKKLRELILELAVRGKLVSQDPSDEPASVILKKTAKEKLKLIDEGKIHVRKISVVITDEEKPFEIPVGWVWARLPDVSDYKPGKTPSTKNPVYWSDNIDDYPWVSISDMEHYGLVSDTSKKITQEAVDQVFKYDPILAGSLIMSFKLTVGKIAILNVDAYHNEAIISIQAFNDISRDYLFKFLPTRALEGNTKRAIMGNTLNATSLSLLLIPIPPIAEQHRIVTKVDELMALCDQLEQKTENSIIAHQTLVRTLLTTLTHSANAEELQQNWARIETHFASLFTTEHSIDQLKQTILQLAVKGILLPQDPNDEPASVLLEKIEEEKVRLIKEGKIKNQKPLNANNGQNKLYGLPKSWMWIPLGNLVKVMDAGWSPACIPEPSLDNEVWGVLKTTAVQVMKYLEYENKILPADKDPRPQYEVKTGDILITRAGPKNRVAISCLVEATRPKLMISDKIIRFHLVEIGMCEKFISLCLNGGATAEYLESVKSGMAESQMNISQDKLRLTPIPLCPITEQYRIVAKVDELMALCDALKERITLAQATQINLTTAIVAQAVN